MGRGDRVRDRERKSAAYCQKGIKKRNYSRETRDKNRTRRFCTARGAGGIKGKLVNSGKVWREIKGKLVESRVGVEGIKGKLVNSGKVWREIKGKLVKAG